MCFAKGGTVMSQIDLCALEEMPDGVARGFAVAGARQKVVVVRRGGALHGYLDSCPHYEGGTPMAWKSDAYLNGAGTHLACHSHGALFEIDTGVCVLGPCLGQRLTPVHVDVTGQGRIFAVLPVQAEERT
jgi:nitrite reductase/ring-hydroxylating ferredoxin subunit